MKINERSMNLPPPWILLSWFNLCHCSVEETAMEFLKRILLDGWLKVQILQKTVCDCKRDYSFVAFFVLSSRFTATLLALLKTYESRKTKKDQRVGNITYTCIKRKEKNEGEKTEWKKIFMSATRFRPQNSSQDLPSANRLRWVGKYILWVISSH